MIKKLQNKKSIWPLILGIKEEDLKNAIDKFSLIVQNLSNFQRNVQEAIEKVHTFINNNQPIIQEVARILQNPNIIVDYFVDNYKEKHKELASHGYFISLSNFTIGEIEEISELIKKNDTKILNEYLCNRLNNIDVINEIKHDWENNPNIENRKRFLLRGLMAHYEKDYIVSIPVFLPHIEGILADFFITTGLLENLPPKFQGNEALSLLKRITIDEIFLETDRVQFRRFLQQTKIYDFIEDETKMLNRGKIFHGICLEYDREDWSAKLIYLIDFLCNLTKFKWYVENSIEGKIILKEKLESYNK